MKAKIDLLRNELPDLKIRVNTSYSELTTLGVGSRLPFLAEPSGPEELATLLKIVVREEIPVFVLGGGTNFVGMDAPCPKLGLRLDKNEFSGMEKEGEFLRVGAACRLPELARGAAKLNMGGLAPLAGIPGTLGGALRMNAGASGANIGQFVEAVCGFRLNGTPYRATKAELEWRYRTNSIPEDVFLTGALLKLPLTDTEVELAAIDAELAKRRGREPAGRSAGCSFRNVSELEPAGRLIDECGLKNCRFGKVRISEEHANFLLNDGNATEAEYVELLTAVRRAVAERHGFFLRPEVRFLNPEAEAKVFAAAVPPKVNVLYGGSSSEREVSLRSGRAVCEALTNAGFIVNGTDITECRFYPEMREADIVYPVLHGGYGEDGRIQKVFEENSLRFIGSGSEASLLLMDKIASKKLMDKIGVPTAKWGVVSGQNRALPEGLRYPVILKAPMEGSTIGIVKVDSATEWEKALEDELKFAPEILVEEYIDGAEITVPIVNGQVLPTIEIRSPHGFYDYDAKYVYKDGHTEYFCPPQSVTEEVQRLASDYAHLLYLGAGARDILRVDFIVGKDQVPYMLEGNSLPGCTATSLVPKSARVSGISFERMTSSLVYAAMKRPLSVGAPEIPAIMPPTTEGKTPAFRSARAGGAPNPMLVRLCRWMFRFALILCAMPILILGFQALADGAPGAWIFVVNGLFLLCAEFIFKWFNLLERNGK